MCVGATITDASAWMNKIFYGILRKSTDKSFSLHFFWGNENVFHKRLEAKQKFVNLFILTFLYHERESNEIVKLEISFHSSHQHI